MIAKKLVCAALSCALLLAGCGVKDDSVSSDPPIESQLDQINMTQWQYNEENDVYWQVGIPYCENPADETYETLGLYVPGAYMTGTENGDGTYTCTVNTSGTVGGFTAETAPIVIPVETPGYAAMAAPTGYVSSTASYTDAGFVYVYAGCRGREAGAPTGVTDLKAAIRYIRYTGDTVPGSVDRIFSFGMSGGGGQSALLGATGDSELYTPYLVSDRRGQRRQRRGGGLDVLVPHHQPGLCQRGIRVEPRGNQNRLERGHAGAFRCHGGAVCLVSQCIGADRY